MLQDEKVGAYGPQLGPGWEELEPGIFVLLEPVRLLPAPAQVMQEGAD
jgi:hypothetical protein